MTTPPTNLSALQSKMQDLDRDLTQKREHLSSVEDIALTVIRQFHTNRMLQTINPKDEENSGVSFATSLKDPEMKIPIGRHITVADGNRVCDFFEKQGIKAQLITTPLDDHPQIKLPKFIKFYA